MSQLISAAITPFTKDNEFDARSLERLYEFGLERGIDGFFVGGTMGEWALLTHQERGELLQCACEVVKGRARVLANISDAGLYGILENIERWKSLPHSAWVVMLPRGWAGPSRNVEYVHKIADACDRPLYLYYCPAANGVSHSPQEFRQILAHPRIVGIKNSAGDMRTRRELLLIKQDEPFELMEGEEYCIDEAIVLGCDGTVAGFGCTAPKLMKQIMQSVEAGDFPGARLIQERLIDIYHTVYGYGVPWWNAGQKYALHYMGLIDSYVSRVDSQTILPEQVKADIRSCIDANRDVLF